MRILVTGSAGRLGRKLLPELYLHGHEVIGVDVVQLPGSRDPRMRLETVDLTDFTALEHLLKTTRPEMVIHAAAMTNVDACETEREKAYLLNAELPARLAKICRKVTVRMALISTDYVFDGKAGPYPETALPNPIGYYGKSKLAGENAVLGEHKRNVVVRACVLFGYEPESAPDFVTWLLNKLRKSEPVRIVTDQFSTPTLTENLSTGLRLIAEQAATGIFHIAGADFFNRYDMSMQIAEMAGLPAELITPVDGSTFPQAAPRPKRGGLTCGRAIDELGYQPFSFQQAMQMYFSDEAKRN